MLILRRTHAASVLALSLVIVSSAVPDSTSETCDTTGTCDAAKGSVMLQVKFEDLPSTGAAVKSANASREEARERVRPFTMVTDDKLRHLYDAVEKVNMLDVEGDLVEAGVFKGGSSMLMAIAHLNTLHGGLKRHMWLYDTFEGMTDPSSPKDDPKAKAYYDGVRNSSVEGGHVKDGKWAYGSEEMVKENMYSIGFPTNEMHFVRGKVEDTLQELQNIPEKIAILRLDTDWYESTKAELEHLLPRLQPGGLLVIDDYCVWKGSREATDKMLDFNALNLVREGPLCAYAWKPSNGT